MKRNILFVYLFLFSQLGLFSQEDWKLRKNEDGITIYTRESKNAKVIEFKGITTIEAPIAKLEEILKDFNSYHLWMADLKKVKLLKKINDSDYYLWYAASVPWPLEDRDIVQKFRILNIKASTVITLKSYPEYIPDNKDYVRIKNAEGKWVFTPVNENVTLVKYQYFADPEINVPLWIMNMFIVDGPYDTLKKLKEMAEEK